MRRWLEERFGVHWSRSRDKLRYWLYCGQRLAFRLELARGRPFNQGTGYEFKLGGGETNFLSAYFKFPWLFGVYVAIDYWPAQQFIHRHITPEGWRWSLSIFEEFIWIKMFAGSSNEWRPGNRSWREITINWHDLVYGECLHSKVDHPMGTLPFLFPEGRYDAICHLTDTRWVYPRWGIVKQDLGFWFDFPGGVPCPRRNDPGDGVWGMGSRGTLRAAMADVGQRIMLDRVRHGGPNWKPPVKENKPT